MAIITTAIGIFTVIAFFLGQTIRLNIFGLDFPILDLSILALFVIQIPKIFKNGLSNLKYKYLLIFVFSTIISYLINLPVLGLSLKSIGYLIRLTSLFGLLSYSFEFNPSIKRMFVISLFANVIFGLIQYLFWPDFRYFDSQNWDPHLYRLVSTFFDPTFTGLIYLFLFFHLYVNHKSPRITIVLAICYLAIALTYSRSSLLCFIAGFLFLAIRNKNLKPLIFATILVIATIIVLPRMPGEGTKLERTSSIKAKIVNYQEAIRTFLSKPLIGYGYNNLHLVRNLPQNSHANGGFDSSLLTILTTSGLIGFLPFLLGLLYLFKSVDLSTQTLLVITLIHSLFANSLLYPWTLVSLFYLAKYRT